MQKSIVFLLAALVLSAATHEILVAQVFAPAVNYRVAPRPYTLVSADFDHDGDFDLATAPNVAYEADGRGWVFILKNNGNGTFMLSDSIAVGDGPTLAAADLNNDNFVDLAVADYYTNRIYVLLNNGTGSFLVADSFSSGGVNSSELCASDLDRDGDFDLAVPHSGSNNLSIFFNTGNATFTNPVNYSMGQYPLAAISADLDADRDSDLVVTNNNSGTVCVMLNDSTGGFPSYANHQVRNNPYTPALADLNRDGCLDLIVPNAGPATPFVSVLMGNCDGTFDPRIDLPGCRPHMACVGDFDRDGDCDMAVTNNECNSISIFLNDSAGTFAPHFMLPAGIGTTHVVARDFDGDGDLDIAAENYDNDGTPGNSVSIFINQTIVSVGEESSCPNTFRLDQNYPNPFNPTTTIKYELPKNTHVILSLFNLLGQRVEVMIDESQQAGFHEAKLDAKSFAGGVYLYRIEAGEFVQTKKLVLLR